MKQLIMTSWGHMAYSISAALVLKKFSDAEVEGVSRRTLIMRLSEIAQSKARAYKEIIILGVGWQGEVDEIKSTLRKLKSKKIKVKWLSIMPAPEWLGDDFSSLLELCVSEKHETLYELVSDYFKVNDKEICELDAPDKRSSALSEKQKQWILLIQAAQHSYRNYQAYNDYPDALRSLAGRHALTAVQQSLIKHFEFFGHRELTGHSKAMQRVREIIERVALKDNVRVMIYGESGTGKETVAIHIHHKSPRSGEPFVVFNCASTSTNLLESQLFGYKKGAFTGADSDKDGVFKKADGGTLFLDEVGELSLEIQANILRVLQEGRFTPLGAHAEVKVDVRIIAATNRNLPQMIKEGKFREDLFFRLNVVPISVPALRERMGDMIKIADQRWFSMQKRHLTQKQCDVLNQHDWPGNVRELYNFLEYAAVMDETDFVGVLNEHKALLATSRKEEVVPDNLNELIRIHAQRVFEKYDKNCTHTAHVMGITRNTLKKYLKKDIAE